MTNAPFRSEPVVIDGVGPVYAPYPLAQFSESLSQTTVTTESVLMEDESGQAVSANVLYDEGARQVLIYPHQPFRGTSWYTVTVTGDVKDLVGNPLAADYVWSFHTSKASGSFIYLPLVLRDY